MSERVALITNVSRFLGPPAVAALSEAGFTIAAHDPGFIEAEERAAFLRRYPAAVALAEQEPEEVVAGAWAISGRVDALVSNDSFPAIHGPIEDANVADLMATIDTLVRVPFELSKASIPRLKEQGSGRVVFATSCRTNLPMRGGAIPDIARAGANALVKSLSLDLAPYDIPVNAVAPNFVYSEAYFPKLEFIDNSKGAEYIEAAVPRGRLGRPEEAGELIRYLSTMEGTFMTGTIIDFAGGWPVARTRPK